MTTHSASGPKMHHAEFGREEFWELKCMKHANNASVAYSGWGKTGGWQNEAPALPILTPDCCRECLQSCCLIYIQLAFAWVMQLTVLSLLLRGSLGEQEGFERRHFIFQDIGSQLVRDSPNGTPVPLKELIHLLTAPENVAHQA